VAAAENTPGASTLGRFFRRLADFFDRSALSRGSAREIRIVGFLLVFAGLITAGTLIHGWHFLFWNFLFASFFCAGSWLIFSSVAWPPAARAFFLAALILVSLGAAADRLLGMGAFILLLMALLRRLAGSSDLRANGINVLAVILLCFSGYGYFSSLLEWRRNAILAIDQDVPLSCRNNRCLGGDVAFTVPEFWLPSEGSNLIRDIQSIAPLRAYKDSATDNRIAFAAFAMGSDNLVRQLNIFMDKQRAFMRSRQPNSIQGPNQAPLVLEKLMSAIDVQLYMIRYASQASPGYLGEEQQSYAFVLLHQRRATTWLFIVDGTDVSSREFLLHRIISGFH